MTDVLQLPLRSLLIFIDETGNEDLSDPKNPTFTGVRIPGEVARESAMMSPTIPI